MNHKGLCARLCVQIYPPAPHPSHLKSTLLPLTPPTLLTLRICLGLSVFSIFTLASLSLPFLHNYSPLLLHLTLLYAYNRSTLLLCEPTFYVNYICMSINFQCDIFSQSTFFVRFWGVLWTVEITSMSGKNTSWLT